MKMKMRRRPEVSARGSNSLSALSVCVESTEALYEYYRADNKAEERHRRMDEWMIDG